VRILQANKTLSGVMPPFPSLELVNKIARKLINEIQANGTIKRGITRESAELEIDCTLSLLVTSSANPNGKI